MEEEEEMESKYPLLRCPVCGYEQRPVMHGWAFTSDSKTKCKGKEEKSLYGHPMQVVEKAWHKFPRRGRKT